MDAERKAPSAPCLHSGGTRTSAFAHVWREFHENFIEARLRSATGFDRQLDCLGRALRDSLDAIRGPAGKTASGWDEGKKDLTLDNVEVTPEDRATAAIYDRTPRVAGGEPGGTSLLWNLWNAYSYALSYSPPEGSGEGRWIGEPCTFEGDCSECDARLTSGGAGVWPRNGRAARRGFARRMPCGSL